MNRSRSMLLCLLVTCSLISYALSSSGEAGDIAQLPGKFLGRLQHKADDLGQRLTRQSEKYLTQLAKQEQRLQRRLSKQDSAVAARLSQGRPDYAQWIQRLHGATVAAPLTKLGGANAYIPNLDSASTALQFLQQDKSGLLPVAQQGQATAALASVSQLQNRLQVTSQIDQLVRQRRAEIQQTLSGSSGISKALQAQSQAYSQKAYYYSAQVQAYKDELNDPDKLTQRAMGILNKNPAYQSFFKNHSELAGLFTTPGGGEAAQAKALAGLQTRATVQAQLHGKVEAGGADAGAVVQQQIQQARSQLKALQQKVIAAGGGSSDMNIPDFRPNSQKVRTLWKRLEYGVNLQSLPSSYVFPATTDFGASLGYRINDRNTIGIGASYKMGWGKDIGHISISGQGVGLRSYLETKIKGSFSATGGFEYNYQTPFSSLQQLKQLQYWTRSGLVGVTKTISLKSRMFSKTKVQLLWDFLSYSQVPKTQAVIFRIGYSFN